ncbi:MAG: hypothetical protein WC201_01460 [Bacilli bacterium]
MKTKDAFLRSKEIYQAHPLNSWVLGIALALFIAAIVATGFIFPGSYIFFIPFFVLPFLFAFMMLHYSLGIKNEVSTKNTFRLFGIYFTRPFRSSFRVFLSFFKTIVVQFLFTILIFIVLYLFFYGYYGSLFTDNLSGLFNTILNQATMSSSAYNTAVNGYMTANGNMLQNLAYIVVISSDFVAVITFCFLVSVESLSIYARLSLPQSTQVFVRSSVRRAIKKQKGSFYSSYIALNWPLFFLLVLGMVVGSLIALLIFNNADNASIFGVICGFILTSFFLPFYFNNMQSLYSLLEPDVKESSQELAHEMLSSIRLQRELNEQEAKELENAIDALNKEIDNRKNIDETDDEENKEKDH